MNNCNIGFCSLSHFLHSYHLLWMWSCLTLCLDYNQTLIRKLGPCIPYNATYLSFHSFVIGWKKKVCIFLISGGFTIKCILQKDSEGSLLKLNFFILVQFSTSLSNVYIYCFYSFVVGTFSLTRAIKRWILCIFSVIDSNIHCFPPCWGLSLPFWD